MLGKKNIDFKEDFDTLVGANATFEGNIVLEGTIRVDGKVNGDLKIKGDVFVGTEALITGNIFAGNVHLAGTVDGNIRAEGTLKILSSAKLHGDIEVGSFVTDQGALFHGKCSMIDPDSEDAGNKTNKSSSKNYKKNTILDQVYDEKEKSGKIDE